jgi:trimethylamine--corrinoid protein Co-methyltransferase
LCEHQLETVYQATLECLERTGVNVLNEEARELLIEAGARADGAQVRIPRSMVEDALAATPDGFSLWGRPVGENRWQDERHRIEVRPVPLGARTDERVYFGLGPTCTYFIDPQTGERRRARRGDPASAALVCNALDNIDYAMGLALIDDVHHRLAPVYEFAEMIVNTAKPILPWAFSDDNVRDIYRIALTVAGSEDVLRERPFFALFATSQAPLQHTDEDLANTLWAVEHDIPVVYLGGCCAGSSSPVTGAGTLVVSLAGSLSGLTIIQLKKEGAPVCIGSVPQSMDLRTARPAYGGPEMSLYSAALSELARYLNLPFMGTAGASEAKTVDIQAGIESTVQVLLSGLSGTTLVHDVGFLDCADIGSLEMLVMNDEIIEMAWRILRGIEITEETLMLDLIDEIGPGGHFIATRETAELCRDEIWTPSLMDRMPWETWITSGAETMRTRIRQRVRTILTTHRPPPLPDGAAEEIEAILQAAEERYEAE